MQTARANKRVRSPRVRMFWWHSPNRDIRPGEFQPYAYKALLVQLSVQYTVGIYVSVLTTSSKLMCTKQRDIWCVASKPNPNLTKTDLA